jgi:hypothetical protein
MYLRQDSTGLLCMLRTEKEGSTPRANHVSARGPGPVPVRSGFPEEAAEKAFEDSKLPLHIRILRAKSARLLGGWSLFSRICLQEGCETKDA